MEDLSARLTSRVTYSELIPDDKCQPLFDGIFCFFHQVLRVVRCALGCWHRHVSRPFTLSGRTYEVCFDCAKQLPYSLEHMSRIKQIR